MAPTSPSQSRLQRHPLAFNARRLGLLPASLLLVGALLAGCSGDKEEAGQGSAAGASQAAQVDVVTVTAQEVPLTTELPGRTRAYQIAEVRPQVGGIIESRDFTEGSDVEEGQVLYHIDSRTYRADVESAKASLARAEASLNTSSLKAKRYKNLVARKMVSQQDYDDAVATVGEDRADVASAKAAVSSAQINLDYTKVTSPISGRIGKSSVTKGALVTASQETSLATVQQLDPIYVDLTQSATEVLRLKRELGENRDAATAPVQTEVELVMEDGSVYGAKGKLQFADVTVDQGTGMVTLRALFPNEDELLLPGMFVRARLTEAVAKDAILIPQKAVSRDSTGQASVMTVNAENKVEAKQVVIGQAIDNQWLVTSGLDSNDKVIVSGLQKIKPGATVEIASDETGTDQNAASQSRTAASSDSSESEQAKTGDSQ
ncbi:efflux RND transporter periplasmic adaptor subunit [Cobetia sp. 29-18-1]|uniref:efflux RND transporter periplasmic adaptor subunit n=1 Tax=Cobetia sp. 29-18-1 TaxID=3040018 RepID=UPI002447DAD2|nr:efflux RND transporter periplasmic adaptor subunit [Cobetia sp. 29-18-1]MDH2298511.1 efflux RND transporter periplasmic adaptor subunit [Cobetia sp. 29-18-1]